MAKTNQRLLLLALVGVVLIQATAVISVRREILSGILDFGALYAGGKLVLRGDRPAYDLPAHLSTENGVSAEPAVGEHLSAEMRHRPDALHPPFEAVIFAPLAALPYLTAFFVWYACNLVLLVNVPLRLWSSIPNLHARVAWVVLAVGTLLPVLMTLVQGQDSILLLLLLTLFYVSFEQRREFRAGAFLALGMFKFVLILPIAAALAMARKGRALLGFATGCVGLLLVSFALAGPSTVIRYFRLLLHFSRVEPAVTNTKVHLMPNLRGFLHVLGLNTLDPRVMIVIATLSLLILALVLRRYLIASASVGFDLRFSMLVVTAVVVSYHCYVHDATILVLPVVLAANHFLGPGRRSRTRAVFATAVAVMYVIPEFVRMEIAMPVFFCALVVLLLALYREVGSAAKSCEQPAQSAQIAAGAP